MARAADRALGAAASLRDDLLGNAGGAAGATATAPATTSLAAGPGQGPAVSGFSVAVDWISGFVAAVISAVTTVFLALLFAFLILIDRSNITEEVRGFESSRVSWLYAEVRESLMEVAASVGSILEAFAIISLVETTVIVLVLWILGLPSLLLVGVITFFLGLIPIVGQVVPVLPIAWIAFASGGSPLLVKSLIAYGAVRLIAAYTFEPKVFGRRFHFSMLFTLVSLMIGFKAAGIWGIILGLPIAYSIVRPRTNPHFTITTHP